MSGPTVLVVHNRYQSSQPSGENVVVDLEATALAAAGARVIRFERSSDEIRGVRRTAIAAIGPVAAPTAVKDFARVLDADPPDVVHLHNLSPLISPWVIRTAKSRGISVVQSIHNFRLACLSGLFFRDGRECTECATRRVAVPGVRHGCYRGSIAQSVPVALGTAIHRSTFRLVDRLMPVSDFLVPFLLELGFDAERVTVKPNFMPDPGPPSPVGNALLFAGRLSEEKGIRLLLDSWNRARLPDASLRIAGDGPLRAEVEARVAMTSGVTYLGPLARAEMDVELRRARAVLVPSQCFEALPMSVIDAFRHGRPVVATRVGALASMVDDTTGWSVLPNEIALAEALGWALSRDVAQQKGNVARLKYEATYTPDRVVGQLLEIYRDVMERVRRR